MFFFLSVDVVVRLRCRIRLRKRSSVASKHVKKAEGNLFDLCISWRYRLHFFFFFCLLFSLLCPCVTYCRAFCPCRRPFAFAPKIRGKKDNNKVVGSLSLSLSRPFVSAVGISRGEKRERLANNDSRWPNLQPDFGCLFPLLWNRLLLPFHSDSSCHSPYSTPYTRVVLASMLARFNRENRGRLRKASSLFLSLPLSY